jgi:hypothetical protein
LTTTPPLGLTTGETIGGDTATTCGGEPVPDPPTVPPVAPSPDPPALPLLPLDIPLVGPEALGLFPVTELLVEGEPDIALLTTPIPVKIPLITAIGLPVKIPAMLAPLLIPELTAARF